MVLFVGDVQVSVVGGQGDASRLVQQRSLAHSIDVPCDSSTDNCRDRTWWSGIGAALKESAAQPVPSEARP